MILLPLGGKVFHMDDFRLTARRITKLKKLEAKHPNAKKIHMIVDNATYDKSRLVNVAAENVASSRFSKKFEFKELSLRV